MNAYKGSSFWLARWLFLRLLGLVYLAAFLVLVRQGPALLGSGGLLPIPLFFERVGAAVPSAWGRFWAVPSIFWLNSSDAFLWGSAWAGAGFSAAVLAGFDNAAILAVLWALYASFVHAGQVFYGYGWEMMMIEAGFLAIFLRPLWDWRPFPKDCPPPRFFIWFLRWMLFRVMFGAGMIKLRGDACWRDLTCLYYHFETQPIPNPLSFYFHHLSRAALKAGVLFNHFAELAAPWLLFGPHPVAEIGGLAIAAFQIILILSGNLSWLNWLTAALCVSSFDDAWLRKAFPSRFVGRISGQAGESAARRAVLWTVAAILMLLSVAPALNLLSPRQMMNASFDPVGIVNTYGAFGSVGKERLQLVMEGTSDPTGGPKAEWREYEFKCQPGDVARRPCVVSPYHERLDWQMWFAAMEDLSGNPWLVHLVYKLLDGDRGAAGLLASNPFPAAPPRFIRLRLFRYRFTEKGEKTRDWWRREPLGLYLPPVSKDNPGLRRFIAAYGWAR